MQRKISEQIEDHAKPNESVYSRNDDQNKMKPDDFRILKLLGKGSYGEVYLVKYKATGKLYAMKVLSKEQFVSQHILKYAIAERNILKSNNHPFIMDLSFAFQTSDKLFLVLKYCPGYF